MPRAGLNTDNLVATAAALSDTIGFEHTSLAELARHVGVRLPSLYAHLRNAEELRHRVALYALDRLATAVAEAIAGRSGRDAILALADAHRAFAAAHPGQFEAARQPLPPHLAAESGGARISRMTRAALRDYHLGEPAETHAVRLLGSFLLGFTTLEAAGGFAHSGPPPDLSWTASLDAIDRLLRAWPAT